MFRTALLTAAFFLGFAVVASDTAQAQWGGNSRSRGWGSGNSGWGGGNSGWGGGNNHNHNNSGLGGLFGGIGQIVEGASGGSSGSGRADVGKIFEGIGRIGDAAISAGSHDNHWPDHGSHWPDHGNHWPSHGNHWPQHTPSTVVVRPQVVEPQTHTVLRPNTEVQPNEAPLAGPEPKEESVALERNSFELNGSNITAADIHNTKESAKEHVDDTVDDIRDDLTDKLKDDVDDLGPGYSAEEKREIKDRLERGESVDDLIKINTKPEDVADRLRKADDAFDALDEIADDAKKGRLDPDDLNDFEDDFGDMVDSGEDLTDDLDTIGEDSFWIDQMDNAQPGGGGFPPGSGTQIVYVPNMPSGQVVNLGNGTVLVGTGGATGGVVMMTGNAAQVAGLSVGVGQPVPDSEAEELVSGVLLLNKGEQAVNYSVEADPFTMTPDYRQILPGGRKWTIEFDRGAEYGKAKYGIADGTYAFTPTEDGWELFEQPPFEVTIDNRSNDFPFHYVLNNTPQTVDAGQANQHSNRYPLIVRFDNGAGQERRKSLNQGEYALAVTPEGTLDLFEATYVQPPIRMEQIAKAPTVKGRALLELGKRRGGGLFSGNNQSAGTRGGLMTFR